MPDGELSIQDPGPLAFMTKVIEADRYTTDIMREGLGTEFLIPPPPKFENDNNKSACDNMDFIREKVAEWERDGFVTKLASKPPCINPLTVAIKVKPETGEE